MHLKTRLVCSEIIYIPFEKAGHINISPRVLKIYALKIGGNCRGKYQGIRKEKKKFQYSKNRALPAKIFKLEHGVAVFSETFYILWQQK